MATAMVKEAEEEGTFSPQDAAIARSVTAAMHLGMASSPPRDFIELTYCTRDPPGGADTVSVSVWYHVKYPTAQASLTNPLQTLATMRVFFLAMAVTPEVQKRAHAELDAVIGPLDRLPCLRDRESLPYVEALVMECHRWNPILPLALPRTYTGEGDDEYKGYRIPKGSIILANTWYALWLRKMRRSTDGECC